MKLLIVEDEKLQARIMHNFLSDDLHFEVIQVENGQQAVECLKNDSMIDLVLMDLQMPIMNGKQALKEIRSFRPDLPVIILTGTEVLQEAIEVMRLGATDFITKPFDKKRLELSITNSLRVKELHKQASNTKSKNHHITFDNMIGAKDSLSDAVSMARKAATSEISVLITGESGTGKEVFARAIHNDSSADNTPFVAVNCGAIPENLVESILFGHEKGSFTGAISQSIGKFREAEGGTLFLDEIGELKPDIQVKLLRALQEREIDPVGSKKSVKVNVRIISATNKNLEEEVSNGNFRQDLFYRVNVFPICLSPLKDRKSNIMQLVQHFIEQFSKIEKKKVTGYSDEVSNLLQSYDWPGNIRELENIIFRAVVLCNGDALESEHILNIESNNTDNIQEEQPKSNVVQIDDHNAISLYDSNNQLKTIDDIEWEYIQVALDKYNNNVKLVSEMIGIGQSTLYRKISEKEEQCTNIV